MPLELRSLGRPFAIETFKKWFGEDFDYEKVRSFRKEIIKEMLSDGIPLKPGAIEILQYLREQGITVAMATANDFERTKGYLDRIGITGYFDRIICADMVKFGKPAPDIYAHACKELGLEPDETFAVEDSPNGIRSAYKAGCNVIMVPDITGPDEELEPMLYACVPDLLSIKKLL